MARLSNKIMFLIAVVLSLVTAVLVYNYLLGVTKKTNKDMLPVVVAAVDIPPKTRISEDMVKVSYVPSEYMQPGAVKETRELLGILAREQIVPGEQITTRHLFVDGKSVGFTGIIPAGKRAVTVAVSEVTGVAGFIKPGDHVDVMVTFDQSTAGDYIGDVILQNLLVLAVNHETEAGPGKSEKDKKEPVKTATVTLAVNPTDVHYLAVGDDRGKIRLALRPYLAEQGIVLTKPISARELMGKSPASDKGGQSAPSGNTADITPRKDSNPSENKNSLVGGKGIFMIRGTKIETVAF